MVWADNKAGETSEGSEQTAPCLSPLIHCLKSLSYFLFFQGYEQQDINPIKIGSQFIMSKKNSSFLYLWYESYIKDYRGNDWAYNALIIPGRLSKKYPNLIHVPPYYFTRPMSHKHIHYWQYDWSLNYAIHMFQRYYRYHIDENSIRTLDTTVGSISRHVLFNNKELCQ